MPRDFDPERFIRETLEKLEAADPASAAPVEVDNGIRCNSLAEHLAVLAAEARAAAVDEGLVAEIVLRSRPRDREDLAEAERVMRALNYRSIADVLRRLAKTAPKRVTPWERVKVSWRKRQAAYDAAKAARQAPNVTTADTTRH